MRITFLVFVAAVITALAGTWMIAQYNHNPAPANPEQYKTEPAKPGGHELSNGDGSGEQVDRCASPSDTSCLRGAWYVHEDGSQTNVDTGATRSVDH